MLKKLLCYFILNILATCVPAYAACENAQALYNQALSQNNLKRKIALLEQSVQACRNFNAFYELAKAYETDNQLEKAELCLRDAQTMNEDASKIAKAIARQGQVLERMNKKVKARICYQKSYKLHPLPQVLEKLKLLDEHRMRRSVSNREIKRFFMTGYRAHQVEPRLNLYINFEYDKAVLNSSGKAQADELGRMLADPVFQKRSFTLIGHTDIRGGDDYNQGLSERRAAKVKAYLAERFGIVPGRLNTIGEGKRKPLYQGDTEREHALNRRVEVRAE